jgi:hypothetical protein
MQFLISGILQTIFCGDVNERLRLELKRYPNFLVFDNIARP